MANLYEKFGRVAEAEQTYVKVSEQNPKDAKACGALAAFYNKPLWDDKGEVWVENTSKGARRAKFDAAIATLERCADIDPTDPSGHYKLAMFYWDKAYRDPMLGDKEKNEFADKGIETVDISLEAKPDYWEAIITKGLLYRVKAQVAPSPAARKQYLDQAVLLQKQAMELRKESQAATAAGAGADIPPEAAAATEAPKSQASRPWRPAKGAFPRGRRPFSLPAPAGAGNRDPRGRASSLLRRGEGPSSRGLARGQESDDDHEPATRCTALAATGCWPGCAGASPTGWAGTPPSSGSSTWSCRSARRPSRASSSTWSSGS